MELRSLKYFVVVAEELNITRAAERLHMSQPPLSHQIQLLEDELGAQLFIRGKRHLTLTNEGSILLRRAREIIDLEEHTCSEIKELKNGISGTLNISLVEGRAPYYAARWIAGFRDEFPNVQYDLWNGSSDDVTERIMKGLADVGVVAVPYDTEHLESIEVGGEPWVAIIPRDNPLAQEMELEIDLNKLVGQPLIIPARKSRVISIRKWFDSIGCKPTFLCTTSNYLDAVALSEQGVGISIFPQTTYTPNDMVVSKPIKNPSQQAKYVLVWKKDQRNSDLTEEFIQYVNDFIEEDKINSDRFRVKERNNG